MSTKVKLKEIYLIDKEGKQLSKSFDSMVTEISYVETLDFPCMRMTVAITDSVGMIKNLTGNELVKSIIELPDLRQTRTYTMRIYRIGSRIRFQKNEKYVIECVSDEFMINELSNVFSVFKDRKVSEIVKELLTNNKYINTNKSLNIEETKDKFKCVVPNWRVFDTINWMASKSVRSKNANQSGFLFWENTKGFNFKSFDQIILDAKDKKDVFTYRYQMKNLSDKAKVSDVFNIETISFPNLFDSLYALRNGQWAGVFTGLSLDVMSNSRIPTPGGAQIPYKGRGFDILEVYKKMEHLGNISPYDEKLSSLYKRQRRNRYRIDPRHLWDTGSINPQTLDRGNYETRWEDTAIYSYCRKLNFEAIKLEIRIPGNLELHAGEPIDVEIPDTLEVNGKIELDRIYSGRYIIAGIRHRYAGGDFLMTELVLVKDSLGVVKPK